MYFRPNWAFYSSTYPFVYTIVISWWLSNLLFENYQPYDFFYYQKICTFVLVGLQCIHSIQTRRKQYQREYLMVHNTSPTCRCYNILLDLIQITLVISWFICSASILNVSPWRNYHYKSTICLLSAVCVIIYNLLDYYVYNILILKQFIDHQTITQLV